MQRVYLQRVIAVQWDSWRQFDDQSNRVGFRCEWGTKRTERERERERIHGNEIPHAARSWEVKYFGQGVYRWSKAVARNWWHCGRWCKLFFYRRGFKNAVPRAFQGFEGFPAAWIRPVVLFPSCKNEFQFLRVSRIARIPEGSFLFFKTQLSSKLNSEHSFQQFLQFLIGYNQEKPKWRKRSNLNSTSWLSLINN